jgi:hypothetical protein
MQAFTHLRWRCDASLNRAYFKLLIHSRMSSTARSSVFTDPNGGMKPSLRCSIRLRITDLSGSPV